jgi:ATP-dependent Clp protease ATP-binding subunit ClpC
VFERFTKRARQVVVYAQDEARALKHNYIGTEHLLLGLMREEEGPAARVLEGLDFTVEEVRAQVTRIVGEGEETTSGQIPFTPRAKKALELSLREALALGHNYIGTEHVLLGLVRVNEGVASRILLEFDADADKVRSRVLRSLGAPAKPVDPELRAEIERVRAEKEAAIARGDDEQAAALDAKERRLRSVADEPVPPPPGWATSGFRARDAAIPFVFGWLLFGVSLAVGILVGWLIWGL